MIFLPLAAISNEPDDRTDEPSRSAYLSGKDLKWLTVGFVVLIALLTPIYLSMRERSYSHICVQNLQNIYKATQLYVADKGGSLPVTYIDFNTYDEGSVSLTSKGLAETWVTDIAPYLGTRSSFKCPAASDAENVRNFVLLENPKTRRQEAVERASSYGMYGAYSGYPTEMVDRPSETVLFADSSNRGANGTLDPLPFRTADGRVSPWDGFVIGWDTSNQFPTSDTKATTRLAYPNTAKGVFDKDGRNRHPSGNHFIFLDGHLETLNQTAGRVKMSGGFPSGLWSVPPSLSPTRK
jgi:hypothetical protein